MLAISQVHSFSSTGAVFACGGGIGVSAFEGCLGNYVTTPQLVPGLVDFEVAEVALNKAELEGALFKMLRWFSARCWL